MATEADSSSAFGGFRFFKGDGGGVDDPHYNGVETYFGEFLPFMNLIAHLPEMKKYPEVPQWWYLTLFVLSLAVGIGCSVSISVAFL